MRDIVIKCPELLREFRLLAMRTVLDCEGDVLASKAGFWGGITMSFGKNVYIHIYYTKTSIVAVVGFIERSNLI